MMKTAPKNYYFLFLNPIPIFVFKKGLVREEIQKALNISTATLKTHLTHIYDKTLQHNDLDERADKFSALLYFLFSLCTL